MHARVASGVFLALGFADLAFLNLMLAPRLAAEKAREVAAESAPREAETRSSAPPANPPAPVTVVKPNPPQPAPKTANLPAGTAKTEPVQAAPDVLFDLQSERVTSMAAAVALHRVAHEMRVDPGRRLLLRGHSDKLGSPRFNVMLSRRRADSVRHFLMAHGAPADRIEIEAVGDAEPAEPGDGFLAWAKNRRVQVLWR